VGFQQKREPDGPQPLVNNYVGEQFAGRFCLKVLAFHMPHHTVARDSRVTCTGRDFALESNAAPQSRSASDVFCPSEARYNMLLLIFEYEAEMRMLNTSNLRLKYNN
jgi:hypothetical protein